MPTVDLIYARDCPNVAQARANLLRAFAETRLEGRWLEWDRADRATPEELRTFGSPTILVNQRDIAGLAPSEEASCRLYRDETGRMAGVPPVALIVAALRGTIKPADGSSAESGRFHWRGPLVSVPGVGAALLPVGTCPACLTAYAGVLGSLGLSGVLQTEVLLPLTAIGLLIALGGLAYGAKTRWGYGPFSLGILATAAIAIGKFAWVSDWLQYGGIGLLIGASVWNAWPRKRKWKGNCPACVSPAAQS